MNEEPEELQVNTPAVALTTAHEHEYMAGGINENGLRDVYCNCGHGMQVDPLTKVENGKLVV
jgi:hypothetical protein